MAESLLVVDELLLPIAGEDPAGESMPFSLRAELEEARKEINPDDFDATDPLRPTEPKKADWPAILDKGQHALKSISKHLELGTRLTEALTKLQGFTGLVEGLVLLRRLVNECWDRMHPVIEDGDLEVRAGPFNWLGDDGRGARFPYSLRTVPILRGEDGSYSLRDWRLAQEGKGAVKMADIDKAIGAMSREKCQALVDGLTHALREFNALIGVLNEKLGRDAPGMNDIRKVLDEALSLATQLLQRKGGPAEAAREEKAVGSEAAVNGVAASVSARAVVTRDDIYHRLGELADQLEKLEPHSPVPYLIRRGIELGSMPFPMMMKALIRDDYTQAITEMNRELGIKPPSE